MCAAGAVPCHSACPPAGRAATHAPGRGVPAHPSGRRGRRPTRRHAPVPAKGLPPASFTTRSSSTSPPPMACGGGGCPHRPAGRGPPAPKYRDLSGCGASRPSPGVPAARRSPPPGPASPAPQLQNSAAHQRVRRHGVRAAHHQRSLVELLPPASDEPDHPRRTPGVADSHRVARTLGSGRHRVRDREFGLPSRRAGAGLREPVRTGTLAGCPHSIPNLA